MRMDNQRFGVRLLVLCLLLAGLLLVVFPTFAQEATATATGVPGGGGVVGGGDTVTLPSWALVNLSVLLVAFSALAVIVTAWMSQRNLKTTLEHTSKANKDAVEAAHEALPQTAQDAIDRVLTTVEYLTDQFGALLKFAREVTDGKPNTEPPPPDRPPDALG